MEAAVDEPRFGTSTLQPHRDHHAGHPAPMHCTAHAHAFDLASPPEPLCLPGWAPRAQVQAAMKRKSLSGKNVLSQSQRKAARAKKTLHAD